MIQLKEGDAAPPFNLPADNGSPISLKKFKGKKNVVLYFYPKDDTPGCTVEACGFRDEITSIQKNKAVVLGVSPDSVDRHQKFIAKFSLPFLLLSDQEKKVARDYGVWVKKSMYGREYMGIARTTFIIDKKGKIVKIFAKVKPKGHNQEVIQSLQDL